MALITKTRTGFDRESMAYIDGRHKRLHAGISRVEFRL